MIPVICATGWMTRVGLGSTYGNPGSWIPFFGYDLRGSFVNIHSVVGQKTLGIFIY